MAGLPGHARVVIVGGGIVGVGLLYHLALEGWTDVVLCEKGELTSGSTWHAAGQCPHFNGSYSLSKIHVYGTQLYPRLPELTGHPVSWHGCGGIRLAIRDEEVDWFHRVQAMSRLLDYEAHVISPEEIRRLHPFLDTFDVQAGFLTVTDGHVSPADATHAMAAGARALGATVSRRNRVTGIARRPSGEWEVTTEQGVIVCEHVVNAAGSYADRVGAWTGHRVPIANMLHHYVVTEPLPELAERDRELPVVRDPWSHCYLREETHGILVGPYETEGAHTVFDQGLAWDFESALLPAELPRLAPWLERAGRRLPLFAQAGIRSVIPGAITHTPDGHFLLGPAPGPPNYWMAAGVSIGICQAAGAGKYLAEWMVHGASEINMAEFDPRRFGPWATDDYARVTAVTDYQHMYACLPPGQQHAAGRGLRVSSLHDRLAARGAQFQQVAGWERARWYAAPGQTERHAFRRANWWPAVAEECRAVRERVGLMDLSTFAKYDVTGRDALACLDRLCANRMPRRDGGLVLAHLLTEAGGRIESEVTVTRLGPAHAYVVGAATRQLQDRDLLAGGRRPGEDVAVTDVTEAYGTLVLAGPRAREVLARLTQADLRSPAFPWLTGQVIDVAGVPTRALRVGYVGELGWELHAPMPTLPVLFDALLEAGRPFDLRLFGTYAMNALRLEKAYRALGAELTNEVTLIEAAMERFVAFDKPDFVGRRATLASRAQGPRTRLVYLTVETGDADCLGGEPVWAGDRLAGVTTSGGYGFATGRSLAFAYVEPALAAPGTALAVQILDARRPARVAPVPLYDPDSVRLRA